MTKKHKIIMLPTEKDSPIALEKDYGLKFIGTMEHGYIKTELQQPQHLYILSDKRIKEGDWCLFFWDGGEIGCEKPMQFFPKKGHVLNDGLKKIIATTNPKLTELIYKGEEDYFNYDNGDKINTNKLLPKIPESFIEAYCKRGQDITEVELIIDVDGRMFYEDFPLKLNENNEVIIPSFLCDYKPFERISLTKQEYLRDIKQILDDLNDHAESLPTDADINNYIKNWVNKKYNK